jgi:hypothetical protein
MLEVAVYVALAIIFICVVALLGLAWLFKLKRYKG